jgi:hypothetical protein
LVRQLVAREWEDSVCDQKPTCEGGERRATLLTSGFQVAALENKAGQVETAICLGDLALSRWCEVVLPDMTASGLKDPFVVQDAAKAQRPLDVVVAGDESIPECCCAGRVHVDVLMNAAEVRSLANDHEIQIAHRRSAGADGRAGECDCLGAQSKRTLEDRLGGLSLGGRLQRDSAAAILAYPCAPVSIGGNRGRYI